MQIRVQSAEFVVTAVEAAGYPKEPKPEFAFVGRSNVGKSSLINALLQRRKLVRVSNTPGRTRALNFFDASVNDGKRLHALRFCDLPGYGYAKVSKAERASWQELIESYLRGRSELRGVIHIVDAEVGPSEQDIQMMDWLRASARPIVPVATKIDRLSKAKRIPALHAHEKQLGLPNDALYAASSTEDLGLEDIWWRLFELER